MSETEPLAMSVKETASAFGTAPKTVWREIHEGNLGHVKIRGRVVIPVQEAKRYLEKNFTPPFDAKEEAARILGRG